MRPRQAYHLFEEASPPIFRLTTTLCVRRSILHAWLAEQQAAARKPIATSA
jgi:hypothetical protein